MKQITMDDLNRMVNEINRIAEPLRRAGYGTNNNDEDEKELDAMIEREMEYRREHFSHDPERLGNIPSSAVKHG